MQPTPNASTTVKPPPPPKDKPTFTSPKRSVDYTLNGSAALNTPDQTTYAELNIKPGNTPSPVQLLFTDVPNDTYAELKNA